LLQRYFELVEELGALEKNSLADLSEEEIMRYLDLRREREELAGNLEDMMEGALNYLQDLARNVGEELVDLPGLMESAREQGDFKEDYLNRIATLIGSLEADLERILADCRQLRYELLWGGEREAGGEDAGEQVPENYPAEISDRGKDRPKDAAKKKEGALAEAACALEPACREEPPGEISARDGREQENGCSVIVSPETLKKLEAVMRPREPLDLEPVPLEGQAGLAVLKAACAGGKSRPGKSHKERHRR